MAQQRADTRRRRGLAEHLDRLRDPPQRRAHLLATLNLFAFTLHEVLDCVADLWRQSRSKAGIRRRFFEKLLVLAETVWFRDWTELLATLQGQRRLVAVPT